MLPDLSVFRAKVWLARLELTCMHELEDPFTYAESSLSMCG